MHRLLIVHEAQVVVYSINKDQILQTIQRAVLSATWLNDDEILLGSSTGNLEVYTNRARPFAEVKPCT